MPPHTHLHWGYIFKSSWSLQLHLCTRSNITLKSATWKVHNIAMIHDQIICKSYHLIGNHILDIGEALYFVQLDNVPGSLAGGQRIRTPPIDQRFSRCWFFEFKSTAYCANQQAVEVAVIDSGDCEAWHRARGIKLTMYNEMVTLLLLDVSDHMICHDYIGCQVCAGHKEGGKDACQVFSFHICSHLYFHLAFLRVTVVVPWWPRTILANGDC